MKLSLKKTGPWWILPVVIGLGGTVLFIVLGGDSGPVADFIYSVF